MKEILQCFTLCLGQSEQDKNRLKILGAPQAECFGNIKFAGMPLPVDENKANEMAQAIGDRKVFLISSTHANEEEQFAPHLQRLRDFVENILIIIVPRHPHRGEEIGNMLRKNGFETAIRSKNEPLTESTQIYVADTIGEMGLWYRLAPIVFVGGSLIAHGGQNFMEPARDKCAVIVGPFMHNFVEMLARAQAAHAVWQIGSAVDIVEEVIALFHDEQELLERQQNAYAWTMKEAQVLDGICQVLDKALKNENTKVLAI